MTLTPVQKKFVLHWGEMGTRWGINRTVAQIHALLYLSPQALNAEEITTTLSVARSNVSTSLRELQGWGIVRVVHVLGDRRDHYETLKEVWELFRIIVEERKRREIDPTVALLRQCVAEAAAGGAEEAYVRERIANMLEFLERLTGWYEQLSGLPQEGIRKFFQMGAKIRKLLGLAG